VKFLLLSGKKYEAELEIERIYANATDEGSAGQIAK